MGASRGQVFRTIVLPAIIPELVGGIRVGVALAWGIAVVTELLGAPVGIGKVFSMMLTAQGLDIIIIRYLLRNPRGARDRPPGGDGRGLRHALAASRRAADGKSMRAMQ